MALSYHNLGMVAQLRDRADEAEGWYKKSLAIFDTLDDEPNRAKVLRNLGRLKGFQSDSRAQT